MDLLVRKHLAAAPKVVAGVSETLHMDKHFGHPRASPGRLVAIEDRTHYTGFLISARLNLCGFIGTKLNTFHPSVRLSCIMWAVSSNNAPSFAMA